MGKQDVQAKKVYGHSSRCLIVFPASWQQNINFLLSPKSLRLEQAFVLLRKITSSLNRIQKTHRQESGITISIAGRQIPSLLSSKNTEPWVQTQTVLTFNVVKRCKEICMSFFFLPEEVNCRLQDRIAGHSSTITETT